MDMEKIYRKKAIERLSSPEQLDKLIVIASPSVWLVVLGVIIVSASVMIWGVLGSIPTYSECGGIFYNQSTYMDVYAMSTGQVELQVEKGQEVSVGDVIAVINDGSTSTQIAELEELIELTEAITMDSENDVSNDTTSSLIEIKLSLLSLDTNTQQYDIQIEVLEENLASYKSELSTLEAEYDSAYAAYKEIYYYDFDGLSTSATEVQTAIETANATLAMLEPESAEYIAQVAALEDLNQQLSEIQAEYTKMEPYLDGSWLADKQEEVQELAQEISTLEAYITSAEESIESLETQINVTENENANQVDYSTVQFDLTKEAVLESLNEQLDSYYQQEELNVVTSSYDGIISLINVSDGSIIGEGTSLVTVETDIDDSTDLHTIVCYVSVSEVTKLAVGMEATIVPSNVDQNDVGYITGQIIEVATYPSTTTEMTQVLGDSLLTESFLAGSMYQVVLELDTDSESSNGYAWSSEAGKDVVIIDGTIAYVKVIIDEAAPITKVIPYIKDQLDVTSEE